MAEALNMKVAEAQKAADQIIPVLSDYAKELLSWIKEGRDFAQAQMPDLAHQIVAWGFAEKVTWCIINLIVLVGLALLFFKWTRHLFNEAYKNDDEISVPYGMLNVLICGTWVITVFILFNNILGAVEIAVAPKVYLIEYLSKLVK